VLVTSNLPFEEWTEVFGNERLTAALLDRLTHRVQILEMNGESYRFRESLRSGKPQKPQDGDEPREEEPEPDVNDKNEGEQTVEEE
jgi:hypothetical protein